MIRLLLLLLASVGLGVAQSPARDLGLREAIDLALAQNASIQIARLQVLESRGAYGVVRSGYLPQFGVTATQSVQTVNLRGVGLSFPGVPARVGPFGVFDARPTARQTIFDLSLVHRMAEARQRIRQAELDAESMREATLLGVVDLYLRCLYADASRAATAARLASAEALHRQARDFLESGTGNRLELLRAAAQMETERTALARQNRDFATSTLMLLEIVGLPVDTPVRLTQSLTLDAAAVPPLEEVERRALANRSEIKAVEAKLQAAGLSVKGARAQRLPTLGFEADYGIVGDRLNQGLSTYRAAGRLEIPLFQGGKIAAETSQATARLEQAATELTSVENNVRLDVRVAFAQLTAAHESAAAAQRAASAGAEAVELAQLRFEAGVANNLEVVDAQKERARTDELEVSALYELYLARANLAKAVGDIASFLP